jgi:methyltransferase-like protein
MSEWRQLIDEFESSQLTQVAFCKLHNLSESTFYAKRSNLKSTREPASFVKAEIVETKTHYQARSQAQETMVLSIHGVTLALPVSTPASYVAELMRAFA